MQIVVSEDKERVKAIREKIRSNGGYCPCNPIKNEDTKCICKDFLYQKELGTCRYGLYNKIE